ncbi:hypothetical protein C9374_007094 [Naegleria lovaniensis]|uniref:Uncharacterized protein n=1 Tax=Naegleria lovaniensis TaxID=51637 RepID=A0AA88KPU4_NAELO|nr:uncharacterized protein C9374_007094 [Naegleria lovaniensis]KAG2393563.1 hypothetical protein C9374_007094 [Naegleria lovaniensis]
MSALLSLVGGDGFGTILKSVPKLNGNLPLIVLILNIFLPGIGTLVAAFFCEDDDVFTVNAVSALLQFLTAICIIGWVWSIGWGYLIYQRGSGAGRFLPSI